MSRCPNGLRRIEGKCVYKYLYNDCNYVARVYRKGEGDLWAESLDIIRGNGLNVEDGKERYRQIKSYEKKGGKVRWDDVYYIVMGAPDEEA